MANKPLETRAAPITHQYVDDILETGTYGTNRSDVIRALIEAGIREAIRDRIITVRRGAAADTD